MRDRPHIALIWALLVCSACEGTVKEPGLGWDAEAATPPVQPTDNAGVSTPGGVTPVPSSGQNPGESGQPGPSVDPAPQAVFTCTVDGERLRGRSHARLRRLANVELAHTLEDLLGPAYRDPEIATRIEGLPADIAVKPGDFVEGVPTVLATALSQVARQVREAWLPKAEFRKQLAPCAEGGYEDVCLADVVRRFGARVWRRDLEQAEVNDYLAFVQRSGGGETGVGAFLERVLQSPSLVFHLEPTSGEVADGRLRLTPFEVAARIAYSVTESMPDEELFDAARNGRLATSADVARETKRLLLTARGRAKALDFARYYADLSSRSDPPADVAARRGITSTAGLADEMLSEGRDFFEYVIFETNGTFSDLMTSGVSFPRTERLSRVFGSAVGTDGPVATPSHPGLLHRPLLLASSSERTNPIVRGATVRKRFLCTDLTLPSDFAGLIDEAKSSLDQRQETPNRDAVTAVTDVPGCRACHTQINPLGFTFEGFDQLGMPREAESIVGKDGQVLRTLPIDTRVSGAEIDPGVPIDLADSRELGRAIGASETARACFSQRLFEYYRRAALDVVDDACLLADTLASGPGGSLRDVFARVVANEDVFYRKDSR